jgi:hypothetical protein
VTIISHLGPDAKSDRPPLTSGAESADREKVTTTDTDPTLLPDDELGTLLGELVEEERQLSKRRDALHRRIDFVNAGGGGHEGASAELLESLRGEERHVSSERQALQRRIDLLRAEQLRRHATR